MGFWQKMKKDLQKGIGEGIVLVKEGAAVVQKKAEELTEEGKKRYRLYELQTKVQKEMGRFGQRVYDLSTEGKDPMLDSKVKAMKAGIAKLQDEICELEGKPVSRKRKAVPKKRTRKKPKEPNTATGEEE
ncbi:MAG TPA: hypothetical protein VEI46_07325 [Thermodesulfovibrionales bacterium]|nr:hypothetical protein [Thermodesulfovibrionales bacterium]